MTLVIGVGGLLTAGKDVFADRLVEEHGFVKLGMSDTLAEALRRLNPWIAVEGYVGSGDEWVEIMKYGHIRYQQVENILGYVEAKKIPEVRRLLQVLGTEVGRQLLGENIWVDAAKKKIIELSDAGQPVVITGIRYPNELKMIQELGFSNSHGAFGTTVWVERPGVVKQGHSSEGSVSAEEFEYVLDNDSTLEALQNRSSQLLEVIRDDFNS